MSFSFQTIADKANAEKFAFHYDIQRKFWFVTLLFKKGNQQCELPYIVDLKYKNHNCVIK